MHECQQSNQAKIYFYQGISLFFFDESLMTESCWKSNYEMRRDRCSGDLKRIARTDSEGALLTTYTGTARHFGCRKWFTGFKDENVLLFFVQFCETMTKSSISLRKWSKYKFIMFLSKISCWLVTVCFVFFIHHLPIIPSTAELGLL